MSTISELMEGKKPGEIKVKYMHWTGVQWFSPYFLAGNDCNRWWYGVRQDGLPDEFVASTEGCWMLYTEPKRKKKVAPYILKWNGGHHVMTTYLYTNDDEVRHSYKDIGYIDVVQRITTLEVEVDE